MEDKTKKIADQLNGIGEKKFNVDPQLVIQQQSQLIGQLHTQISILNAYIAQKTEGTQNGKIRN